MLALSVPLIVLLSWIASQGSVMRKWESGGRGGGGGECLNPFT